jgi:predicted HAD superfamily Cof-like phosphohydrolase
VVPRPRARGTAAMLSEFHTAVSHPDTDLLWLRRTLHDEEHAELVEALEAENRIAVARELADVVYVAYGTAHAFGIDLDAALAEVHRANMQKAHGPRRADGKALKPADFVPPDMSKAVGLDDEAAD